MTRDDSRLLNDDALTNYIKISSLALHGIGIDLTHVPSTIRFSDLPYVKVPRTMIAVGHGDAMILRDHVTRDREDRLSVDSQPRHL